jgi:hypothetical protein
MRYPQAGSDPDDEGNVAEGVVEEVLEVGLDGEAELLEYGDCGES